MTHWSQIVKDILISKSGDLRELADIAGRDYKTFYTFQSLAGCDLCGQDLREFNLEGCDLNLSKMDENTLLDSKFEFRTRDLGGYFSFSIPVELNIAIIEFSRHYNYVYRAWAYKNLIERFRRLSNRRMVEIHKTIVGSHYFHDLVLKNSNKKFEVIKILLNEKQSTAIRKVSQKYPQFDSDTYCMLSGLVASRFPYLKHKASNQLDLDSIW